MKQHEIKISGVPAAEQATDFVAAMVAALAPLAMAARQASEQMGADARTARTPSPDTEGKS